MLTHQTRASSSRRANNGGGGPGMGMANGAGGKAGGGHSPSANQDTAPALHMPSAKKRRAARKHLTNAFMETLHNSQRRWGKISTSELPKVMQQAVISGSKVTAKGHEYFADAWTAKLLHDHGVPMNPVNVQEFVHLETLVKFRQKAHVLAAKTVAEGSAMLAQALQDALNHKQLAA
jgi:hypothetical protein